MIRALSVVLLAFAAPVAAQAPEGVMMRVDRSSNPQDPDDVPEVTITAVGDGFQVSTGPAVMLWREDQRASGNYTLSGRFTLLEPSSHRNYYGLVFGGRNLTSENQWYLYFVVAQTGEFVVNGTVVHATERSGSLLDTNGLYGVRINHVLPGVLVENLSVTGM